MAARNYLTANGYGDYPALEGLLQVWADECGEDAFRREAQLIAYEL